MQPLTPQHGTPITTRIQQSESRQEHAMLTALDAFRRERQAEDVAKKQESEFAHREMRTRFNTVEAANAEAFRQLKTSLDENTKLTREVLAQATKTNGRVDALEKIVGDDDSKGLRARTTLLEASKNYALGTLALVGAVGGIFWLVFSEEIKARGLVNYPKPEILNYVEQHLESRGRLNPPNPRP